MKDETETTTPGKGTAEVAEMIELARQMSANQDASRVVTVRPVRGSRRREMYQHIPATKTDWDGDGYTILLTEFDRPAIFLGDCDAVIQIAHDDGTAGHDWREFQQIKNQIVGEDWFAVEVYPPERFVIDPSNAFYLWCWKPKRMHVGWHYGRRVLGPDECIAPQRPFPAISKAEGK